MMLLLERLAPLDPWNPTWTSAYVDPELYFESQLYPDPWTP
jgi:hypothetical protein